MYSKYKGKDPETLHGPEGIYIEEYKKLRDTLNKRMITDSYIENAAKHYNAFSKEVEVIEKVFNILKLGDPYKAVIDCRTVEKMYWREWKKYIDSKGNKDTKSEELEECKLGLCDGAGFVYAKKQDGYEHVFRCMCEIKKRHQGDALSLCVWSKVKENQGFTVIR